MSTINRRDLLLAFGGSSLIVFPTLSHAVIPPPPVSPWYLLFIADGIYRISGFYKVTLPASAGNCRAYSATVVSQAVGANLSFTGRYGISAWNTITGSPQQRWWEVYDRRNGLYVRLFEYDRFEVTFSDGSSVKVSFRGPNATIRFVAIVGTERLPDRTRLDGTTRTDRPANGGGHRSRDGGSGGYVTPVSATLIKLSWSWGYSSQEMPW
jgi:hypothetical protein